MVVDFGKALFNNPESNQSATVATAAAAATAAGAHVHAHVGAGASASASATRQSKGGKYGAKAASISGASFGLSDSALLCYCRCHHLLLFLADAMPGLKTYASQHVERFVTDPTARRKYTTPNLGEFILYVLLAERGFDDHFQVLYGTRTFL